MTRHEMAVEVLVEYRGDTREEAERILKKIQRMIPTVPMNVPAEPGDRALLMYCLDIAAMYPEETKERAIQDLAALNRRQ